MRLIWLLPLLALPAVADAGAASFVGVYHLPHAPRVVAIREGGDEPPGRGSYAVRIYGGTDPQRPRADFIAGTVRGRSGRIEEVAFRDLDGDGRDEILVLLRAPGSAGRRAADALGYRNGLVFLVESVTDLAPGTDPVAALQAALASCDCSK